jgi:hypothetical protein
MATILVNYERRSEYNSCQTWGELLDLLDQALGPQGQIVTAVRFDGVDEPAFRDPAVAARRLEDETSVEIECGRPTDLLARTLDDTLGALDTLCVGARRVGEAFRGYDVSDASHELRNLAEGFHGLVSIIRAIALALQVDLQHMEVEGRPVSSMIAEFVGFADALIEAQQAADWLTVADIVEYDIAPGLDRWRTVVQDFRSAVS